MKNAIFLGKCALMLVALSHSLAWGTDHLLITEVCVVSPPGGQFVEIYNGTETLIDLSDYYLTNATQSPEEIFYFNIVAGQRAGGGYHGDFHARFPAEATIARGEYQTIAISGNVQFHRIYEVNPTYELFEDESLNDAVPNMKEAFLGSIGGQGRLDQGGDNLILYRWDGMNDLVQDVDYLFWGGIDQAVCKTDFRADGPDPDTDSTSYRPDTPKAQQEAISEWCHEEETSWQRTQVPTEMGEERGGNGITGHDETGEHLSRAFEKSSPTPNASAGLNLKPTTWGELKGKFR